MVIFHSYVSLPEGSCYEESLLKKNSLNDRMVHVPWPNDRNKIKKRWRSLATIVPKDSDDFSLGENRKPFHAFPRSGRENPYVSLANDLQMADNSLDPYGTEKVF